LAGLEKKRDLGLAQREYDHHVLRIEFRPNDLARPLKACPSEDIPSKSLASHAIGAAETYISLEE
jgi:hypothetical protein